MQKLKKNLKPAGRKRVVLTGRSNDRSEILDRTGPGWAGPGRPATVTGYNYGTLRNQFRPRHGPIEFRELDHRSI
jgi:hypothetical protein